MKVAKAEEAHRAIFAEEAHALMSARYRFDAVDIHVAFEQIKRDYTYLTNEISELMAKQEALEKLLEVKYETGGRYAPMEEK